jgi:DNA-directed RNA polymerase specialized sigma24 family protein
MRHADDEMERAARRFDQLADEPNPATAEVDHTDDLRAIAAGCEAVRADEARLREAIEVARVHEWSWNQIAVALGVSRQAARQRWSPTRRTPDRPDSPLNGYLHINACRLGGTCLCSAPLR